MSIGETSARQIIYTNTEKGLLLRPTPFFNISRGCQPGRRTNQPTWHVSVRNIGWATQGPNASSWGCGNWPDMGLVGGASMETGYCASDLNKIGIFYTANGKDWSFDRPRPSAQNFLKLLRTCDLSMYEMVICFPSPRQNMEQFASSAEVTSSNSLQTFKPN